ncbi:MAG: succinylglutamate desuccinylase/aspartoacylase family protein [Myxococcales bacterium]|nr:succinylglutamate desuccinylase/aspartoacylase family protein [Myxococcales bacterium]MCB9750013.1 succinylglutamate desuccinylase/aspartoacylase family protein [Myxococcales bacterium]
MTLEPPPLLDSLELDQFAPGVVHRLRLCLSHNALGREFAAPVLIFRAAEPGPVVGITSAIHGNELNGIPTIHRLFDKTGAVHNLTRGCVVAVPILNTPGYLRFQREFHDGRDLNRIMPGRADGNSAEVYAHRILELLVRHFDYLIDLHTASFGRVNTLYVRADMNSEAESGMARAVRPQIIVNNDAGDGTLRGAASRAGVPSITIEIGDPQRIQPGLIRASRLGVQEVLEHVGLLPDIDDPDPRATTECSRSFWLFTDTGGILEVFPPLNARVKKGEIVATITDPWGRVVARYPSPIDGIVVGKSTNPAAHTGARIIHLGVVSRTSDG